MAFVFKVFSCEIKNFQLGLSLGPFPQRHTHPFQTKSSHAEPFAAFYFSLFLFSKTLVLQTVMRANTMTQAECLSLSLSLAHTFFLSSSLCVQEVASKSYGRACTKPENNGIIFVSLPPIKVSYKRKKASLFNTQEILKTLTNEHPLTTT